MTRPNGVHQSLLITVRAGHIPPELHDCRILDYVRDRRRRSDYRVLCVNGGSVAWFTPWGQLMLKISADQQARPFFSPRQVLRVEDRARMITTPNRLYCNTLNNKKW